MSRRKKLKNIIKRLLEAVGVLAPRESNPSNALVIPSIPVGAAWYFRPGDIKKDYTGVRNLETYRNFIMETGNKFAVGSNELAPSVTDEGYLDFTMDWKPTRTNSHTMIRPNAKNLPNGRMQFDYTYHINMQVKPTGSGATSYATAFQGWGPSYPDGAQWYNPPIMIYTWNGMWKVALKPENPIHTTAKALYWKVPCQEQKWASLDITYKPSNQDGILAVSVDGKCLCNYKGRTVLQIPTSAGPYMMVGTYTYTSDKDKPVGFTVASMDITIQTQSPIR